VSVTVPKGDNRPRHVCGSCGAIHYQNPRVVTGCIAEWRDKVLLCRRAIEPRYGCWTLPAGFLENGESSHAGAARETLEEANARVEVTELYTLFDLPRIDQIYMLYRGRLLDLDFAPGDESLEVMLCTRHQVPWEKLAFQVMRETLKLYFRDQERNDFRMRSGTIEPVTGAPGTYRTTLLSGSRISQGE
jgi:ADP-ribose pyrophosphatase YjhB (NUDIX family)